MSEFRRRNLNVSLKGHTQTTKTRINPASSFKSLSDLVIISRIIQLDFLRISLIIYKMSLYTKYNIGPL